MLPVRVGSVSSLKIIHWNHVGTTVEDCLPVNSPLRERVREEEKRGEDKSEEEKRERRGQEREGEERGGSTISPKESLPSVFMFCLTYAGSVSFPVTR